MKYLKLVIMIFVLSFSLLGLSFAANVSEKNKQRMDNLITVVEAQWGKESPINQISKYEKILNSFSKVIYRDEDQKQMIEYLLSLFKDKLNELRKSVMSQSELISNVDWDKVEETWLSWHNATRSSVGLQPYKINKTLNYSALIRANNLATTSRKSSTHWRTLADGYYSYDSIKSWFNDLGINFSGQGTVFSESNAYQYYTCKGGDCTSQMIVALKKAYDFLENEKRSHYPAIVSKYYDQIGYGVAVNGNYVWVTTHYATSVN